MTIKFNNVYLKDASTVAGVDEKEGNFGNMYDRCYDDYYIDTDTFEKAEIKMVEESILTVLKKSNITLDKIDVIIGADLLNQITANAYASIYFNRPFLGVYNACASMCEEIIIASSLLQNKNIKNVLCSISSHNMTAERQYRNPVEYGAPKPKRSTFTVTGAASSIITNDKTNIKVSYGSIGITTDLGVTDTFDMGSVMTPSAARVLNDFLSDTKTKVDDYDLILTGDLGVYGKEILKVYMEEEYNVNLKGNIEDSASIIYDRKKQKHVNAGGSGPACLPLVTYTYVLDNLRKKEFKKVILIATGALMSPTMNNQKFSIPSISHLICLEAAL